MMSASIEPVSDFIFCLSNFKSFPPQFVDELLEEAASHRTNAWTCKVYSAHDATLLPLMGIFENAANHGVPEFADDVVLETWVNPHAAEPNLRLKYAGADVVIKGCEQYGALCPLSVVRRAVAKDIPGDIIAACGGEDAQSGADSKPVGT